MHTTTDYPAKEDAPNGMPPYVSSRTTDASRPNKIISTRRQQQPNIAPCLGCTAPVMNFSASRLSSRVPHTRSFLCVWPLAVDSRQTRSRPNTCIWCATNWHTLCVHWGSTAACSELHFFYLNKIRLWLGAHDERTTRKTKTRGGPSRTFNEQTN